MDIIFNFIKRLICHLTFNSTDDDHSIKQGEILPMNDATDVVKAISTYIDTPDTKYAIMIDGDWGCGKTYLWQNALLPMIGKKYALYVSIYGLKDVKDIENEIFKTMSSVGSDDEGILKGILNSNSDIAEDIKFGGLGFAVQFGFKKWKDSRLNKSKSLLICFDDIERWSGDIEICLSYINKLVEYEGTKCLIIGNTEQINKNNIDVFNKSREKTIKFIYKLAYKPSTVLDAAISITNFTTDECKVYIEKFLIKNNVQIFDLLDFTKCSNIRTLSTSIYYFGIIFENNKEKFKLSPTNAVSYFIVLLSSLILVEQYKTTTEEKDLIFDDSIRDAIFLLGKLRIDYYNENKEPKDLKGEELIVEKLIEQIVYQSHEIKRKGLFSIIKNGFYRNDDFEDEFKEWKKTEDYEYYLNTYNYWNLADDEADRIYKNSYDCMFIKKNITDPSMLLVLTDRFITDIKRGVIDLPFDETKIKIRKLFKDLYDNKRMDCVKYIGLRSGTRTFDYCNDIYDEVSEMNSAYYENRKNYELSRFWGSLNENPEKMDDLMEKYKRLPLFSMYEKPEEIVETLNILNNNQLFNLTRWMGHRINEDKGCLESVNKEHKRAKLISDILDKQYGNQFGIRASHMKQIVRVLKNKRWDYDPDYIDELKKIQAEKEKDDIQNHN